MQNPQQMLEISAQWKVMSRERNTRHWIGDNVCKDMSDKELKCF